MIRHACWRHVLHSACVLFIMGCTFIDEQSGITVTGNTGSIAGQLFWEDDSTILKKSAIAPNGFQDLWIVLESTDSIAIDSVHPGSEGKYQIDLVPVGFYTLHVRDSATQIGSASVQVIAKEISHTDLLIHQDLGSVHTILPEDIIWAPEQGGDLSRILYPAPSLGGAWFQVQVQGASVNPPPDSSILTALGQDSSLSVSFQIGEEDSSLAGFGFYWLPTRESVSLEDHAGICLDYASTSDVHLVLLDGQDSATTGYRILLPAKESTESTACCFRFSEFQSSESHAIEIQQQYGLMFLADKASQGTQGITTITIHRMFFIGETP